MTKRRPDLVAPFNVAISGIVHTFRTQRHMRVHLYVTILTVLGAFFLNLRLREILILLFMITFVLVAEMFNSAIEAVVDLASPNYHPLAKFAKDIAAGAVLITTIMSIIVGSMVVLGEDNWERIRLAVTSAQISTTPVIRLLAGAFLVFVCVLIGKGFGSRGQVLQGGMVSGHAAYGFFFATAVLFLSGNVLVAAVAVMLAVIIAQSRYEARYHNVFELGLGAVVGTVIGVLLFGLLPK
jgi:diacylglycerol kinase (ATP)